MKQFLKEENYWV